MGCDIHMEVEYLDKIEGTWQRAEKLIANKYHDPGDPSSRSMIREEWYGDRSYDLFAMLANVRNGRGFAGIPTGIPIEPISQPRGIPEDCSDETQAFVDYWGEDGHSHSYLSLQELAAVPWFENKITHFGCVTPNEYDRFRVYGRPDSWSGAISGPHVEIVSNEEMAARIDNLDLRTQFNSWKYGAKHGSDTRSEEEKREEEAGFSRVYTHIQWETTWAESVPRSWLECLVRLFQLTNKRCQNDLTRVRIVFFFDN